jgi:hypothetical protein
MEMSFCPNCNAEISSAAVECDQCGAVFGAGSSWKPGDTATPDSGTARKVLGFLGTLIVAASVGAQAILIYLLIQHHQPYGALPSESHAFAGMGIMMLSVAAMWVVIPGTLISLVRTVGAFIGLTTGKNAGFRFAVNLPVTLLPLVFFWTLLWSDKPAPAPAPKPAASVQEQRVAGRAWAIDEGISSEEGCNKGTPGFSEGCKSHVRQGTR